MRCTSAQFNGLLSRGSTVCRHGRIKLRPCYSEDVLVFVSSQLWSIRRFYPWDGKSHSHPNGFHQSKIQARRLRPLQEGAPQWLCLGMGSRSSLGCPYQILIIYTSDVNKINIKSNARNPDLHFTPPRIPTCKRNCCRQSECSRASVFQKKSLCQNSVRQYHDTSAVSRSMIHPSLSDWHTDRRLRYIQTGV